MNAPVLRVAVPDGRVAVREFGSGAPVVLVHGGTATGCHDWSAVAPHLAATHRVVVVDVRGHGGSVDDSGRLGVERFATDLVHVLRRLAINRADFVGFSMGANTVLRLLCRRPALGRRAVVVGGSATGDPDRVRALMRTDAWPAPLRALRHEIDPAPDYWRRLRNALIADWAATTEIDPAGLARVGCPVLVVNGVDDPIQSAAVARHLADALPDAHLELVERAAHAVHVDRPDLFIDLLDAFLDPNGAPHVPIRVSDAA